MKTYSATKINLWNQCELKFCAEELLRLKKEKKTNIRLELGSLVHKYFEDFYSDHLRLHGFKTGDIKLSAWQADFEREWEDLTSDLGFGDQAEIQAYKAMGLTCLANFFAREKLLDFKLPVYLEQSFFVDLGQFRLSGKIDRIDRLPDGTLQIIDYKISNSVKTHYSAARDIQLTLYHLACNESIAKESPSSICLYYPLQDQQVCSTRGEAQLEDLLEGILEIDLAIEDRGSNPKLYKANPADWKCEGCVYYDQCPEHTALDIALPADAADVLKLTEEYIQLKAQADTLNEEVEELKAKIKNYMIDNELRQLGSCNLSESVRTAYDPVKTWDLLRSLEDGYKYIDIRKKSLEEDLSGFSLNDQRLFRQSKLELGRTHALRLKRS